MKVDTPIACAFEERYGCSPKGKIYGITPPLFALRGLRDKQVDILRTMFQEGDWDSYYDDLEVCLTDLIENYDLRCLSALHENAANDYTGKTLTQLDAVKELCRIVARSEMDQWKRQTNRLIIGPLNSVSRQESGLNLPQTERRLPASDIVPRLPTNVALENAAQ